MVDNMPAAEVAIDEPMVRRLLAAQFPAGAAQPLRLAAHGWDNVVYRLGPELAVRLPRRLVAAELISNEQRWLPALAARLPLPVPSPLVAGVPTGDFPWPWSVVPWLPGAIAAHTAPADPMAAAVSLGRFVAALHQPAPPDGAPVNLVRGCPLADRHNAVQERLARIGHELAPAERAALDQAWTDALAAPPWDGPPLWVHGDLHPANLLVDDGHVSAVIDFGDLTAGDPATDLAVAWMLFDPGPRARFLTVAGSALDAAGTRRRARGWAVNLALAMLASSADHPTMAAAARRTVANLTTEAG